jgi:predicted nucleotidyltransferase
MSVQNIKAQIVPVLKKYDVSKASLFGSVTRDEATEVSDIDVLVRFEGEKSLLDLAGLKIELEELLGRNVDVLTYDSLHPLLRERILAEQEPML